MRRSSTPTSRLVLTLAFLLAAPLPALEGKWTPDQMLALDAEWLAAAGIEIPAEQLWDGEDGLLRAIIQVGGCSAGVVSAEGLVVTNHHCAFGLIQQHSSPERDLIRDGYLATTRDAELGGDLRALVPSRFHDVTAEVSAKLAAEQDDLARHHLLERIEAEKVAECEQVAGHKCKLATFDDGVRFVLVESIEYPDVRLVYAPPRAIGEYGGEVDNWSWPRHTGDFSVLRIWAAPDGSPAPRSESNRPWHPERHLAVEAGGVSDGSALIVAGYPGTTYRSLIADEAAVQIEGFFATRARIYADWIAILEQAGATDEAARIALASRAKTLANREKNARGQLEAIERRGLLLKRRELEQKILAWARESAPEVVAAHAGLAGLTAAARTSLQRDRLLAEAEAGSLALDAALDIVRFATERAKPDLERRDGYRDRDRGQLEDRLRTAGRRLHPPTEAALLVDLATRAAALPEGGRIDALGAVRSADDANRVVSGSAIFDDQARLAMLDENPAELAARGDRLLALAGALERELEEKRARDERSQGAQLLLRPVWRRGMERFLERPLDPDANSTLRVSFAQVAGYRPRDGVAYTPFTTLGGLLAKHTGEEPFDVPQPLRTAAADSATRALHAASDLGDVPVCFLADADTTGGSSGSPVLDGQGRLVGLNFDRVWENVANDFGYDPAIARNISVDVRFLLWVLEAVEGESAGALIDELIGGGSGHRERAR